MHTTAQTADAFDKKTGLDYNSATQKKKTVMALFGHFAVTELHSREGTALRVACGGGVPQGHPPTRVF